MRKIITTISAVLLCLSLVKADRINYQWSISGGGTGADRPYGITTTTGGEIYVTGVFQNEASFGTISLAGSPKGSGENYDNSLYVVKMGIDKSTMWAIYSNLGAVTGNAVTNAPGGDIILAGNMRAVKGGETAKANIIDAAGTSTEFDNLGDNATNSIRGFVARFNSEGQKIWIHQVVSTDGKNDISDVITDNDGNVYITGFYNKNITLPGSTEILSTNTTQASYIAKLNGATGETVWIRTTSGGINSEVLNKLAFDGTSLYAAGAFKNVTSPVEVSFGGKSITPSVNNDLVFARFDKNGNFDYLQLRASTKDTRVKGFQHYNGNLYLTASFTGSLSFQTEVTGGGTLLNGITMSFDAATGADGWQKTVSCPAITETTSLTIIDNKIYAFGYFYNKTGYNIGEADFGNGKKLTTGDTNTLGDIFLATYDLSGVTEEAVIFAQGTGANTSCAITSINKDLYLFGQFNSPSLSLYNTGNLLNTAGGFDFFIAKYNIESTSTLLNNESDNRDVYYDANANTLSISDAGDISSVVIYDATGKVVFSQQYQATDSIVIVLPEHIPGIYLVKMVSANNEAKTIKIKL